MRNILIVIFIIVNSIHLLAQDRIIVNDTIIIDCRIISIESNLIQFENTKTMATNTILADTIKGYTYQGETYYNSNHREKVLFSEYEDPNTKDTYLRLSFFVPGFSFENRITQSISINAEVGTGFAFGISKENGYQVFSFFRPSVFSFYNTNEGYTPTENYFRLYPYVKFEARKYYSLLRRQNHGRSTINNSANYFSLYSLVYWDDLYFVGPTWGLQRNKNKFYFNLNLGGGIYWWSEGRKVNPLIDVKLGLLLN
ncbi:MAG: hypothetical protein DRJ10_17745 [Bacteroidetes bacterium]|nr:MAG: hypothetical protein DRJ10_17745 [Bacteroidota bacterium]